MMNLCLLMSIECHCNQNFISISFFLVGYYVTVYLQIFLYVLSLTYFKHEKAQNSFGRTQDTLRLNQTSFDSALNKTHLWFCEVPLQLSDGLP